MAISAGLHHVTAIAGDPRRNHDFYTRVLGLRFVKKTVNFDDPGTYHFYFGDTVGSPGTILTFFPWADAAPGRIGAGETHETAFAVPAGALDSWELRLAEQGVDADTVAERFGHRVLRFRDPDGMRLSLVEGEAGQDVVPWGGAAGIQDGQAIAGFAGVTLGVADSAGTAAVLTDVFGWTLVAVDDGRRRFAAPGASAGRFVDLVAVDPVAGRLGAGSVHHVAFRARNDAEQAELATALRDTLGLRVTPQQDRNYFRSVYFREPGGVLFEIATDEPGFAVDEPVGALGTGLMLPARYEAHRARIEAVLPSLG
ncbi:ring-cleaving dioxygenase [Alsobacter sp. R-9]